LAARMVLYNIIFRRISFPNLPEHPMKKLHLDLDSLRVESFSTGAGSAGGTVNGYVADIAGGTTGPILITDPETDPSRVNSCYFNTCYETCDWTQ